MLSLGAQHTVFATSMDLEPWDVFNSQYSKTDLQHSATLFQILQIWLSELE